MCPIFKPHCAKLGSSTLVDTNFHLNLKMGNGKFSKMQEPTALFELTLENSGVKTYLSFPGFILLITALLVVVYIYRKYDSSRRGGQDEEGTQIRESLYRVQPRRVVRFF